MYKLESLVYSHHTLLMNIYQQRRYDLLGQVLPDSLIIVPAAVERYRNRDAEYAFRQDSDFYYLTGFDEPEAYLVLVTGRPEGECVLFNRVRDPQHEVWTGPRLGQKGAVATLRVDQAFPVDSLDQKMPELLDHIKNVYFLFTAKDGLHPKLQQWTAELSKQARGGSEAPTDFIDLGPVLHEMRLVKSDMEIELMRRAAQVSTDAHLRAMRTCKPDQFEYEIEAEIVHEFKRQGCRFEAYTSIVASGPNACVLHYVDNNRQMQNGDLLLIDAGAEYGNYASDVTRTFPVNGKFSKDQRAIYELVLKAQLAVIEMIKPGVTFEDCQNQTVEVLCKGLIELGIIESSLAEAIDKKHYLDFFMHRFGHWLGLDVHDVGSYKIDDKWRPFEPGMVLTVEPGIYISPDNENVDVAWRGIGVRIEDDVLVTKDGCDVLSTAPKTVAEIEAIMAGK